MTDSTIMQVAKTPCGSCPYRRDVPSGLWAREEYEKLRKYDLPMPYQPTLIFLCHQKDGKICAGWISCHGVNDLLALRLHADKIDPSVWTYECDVPVFSTGNLAAAHGIADIESPSREAEKKIASLLKLRIRQNG